MGGGIFSNCSMIEAIDLCEGIVGKPMRCKYVDENRRGDHIWWVSDLTRFRDRYPDWKPRYNVPQILQEIYDFNVERWSQECLMQAKGM
jgi:CDP-paratose 2-epimerase